MILRSLLGLNKGNSCMIFKNAPPKKKKHYYSLFSYKLNLYITPYHPENKTTLKDNWISLKHTFQQKSVQG